MGGFTCWVVVLKVRNDMVLFEVARLERVDKHLVRLFRDSMVGHLHVCTLYIHYFTSVDYY